MDRGRVGTTSPHLVDRARADALAPTARPRKLMVRLWYPADLLTFTTHSRAGARADGTPQPVVVLSPGYGGNAAWHTGLAEELARGGYVVAAIDHTFDVAVVEFPEGRLEPLATDEIADLDRSVATRVADARFVLDQLASITKGHNPDAEHRRLPDGLSRTLDLREVAAVGFSRGTTAVDADWAGFYARLTGPRLYAVVDGMRHNDFTDLTTFKTDIDPNC